MPLPAGRLGLATVQSATPGRAPALAGLTRLLRVPVRPADVASEAGCATLDVDDTIVEVHGHAKQGLGLVPRQAAGSTRYWPPCPPPRLRRWSWPSGCARVVAD